MRCECCDRPLSDKEATAKFVPENKDDAPRYVGMCRTCQGFLPDGITIVNRHDLDDMLEDNDIVEDSFDYEEGNDYGYEE
jgi:hypothetical protein